MVVMPSDSLWSLSAQQLQSTSVMTYYDNYIGQGGEKLSGPWSSISTGLLIHKLPTCNLLSHEPKYQMQIKAGKVLIHPLFPHYLPCVQRTSSPLSSRVPLSLQLASLILRLFRRSL